MNVEIPQASEDKTAGSVDTWKPLKQDWAAQPWTIDAMIPILSQENSTLSGLVDAMHQSVVVQTSTYEMAHNLGLICERRYGRGNYETWRMPLLLDTQRQKAWLAEPGNRPRALSAISIRTVREAISERYKSLEAGVS